MFSLFGNRKRRQPGSGKNLGRAGEDLAASFLEGQGYRIVTRNYRKRFGEIDIIAEDGSDLVFVEVKTRSSNTFGSPLEAVDLRKQLRMARAALDYMSGSGLHDRSARFDVVAVHLRQDKPARIDHVRNAFDLQD